MSYTRSKILRSGFQSISFKTKENYRPIDETTYRVFGPTQAFVYAHVLLWLANKVQPNSIDDIISAEIPDKQQDLILHYIVIKNMIHGPCGFYNAASPCMKEYICSKKYPRSFISETQTGDDRYPTHRRRSPDNGGNRGIVRVRETEINVGCSL
jgi:hypothetical protein